MSIDAHRTRQNGVTLVELIIFIVVVSVAIVGILSVMNITTRASADPMARKQALAIAESLLEEVQLQPFTYCDPDDEAAATATSTASCTVIQGIGPTSADETRYNGFDNVGDYGGGASGTDGFVMNGIRDLTNTSIGGLDGYRAVVRLFEEGPGAVAGDALRIDVTVTAPNGEAITLTGYRYRYAPRAVP